MTAIKNTAHGLPLIEYAVESNDSDFMAILYSGDGGWAAIDKYLAEEFQAQGIPVLGVDCLKYLWRRKSLPRSTGDLEFMLSHYSALWNKKRIIVSGFSRGACILPLIVEKGATA